MDDIFTIANKNFNSRLIVGTGKYKNFEETAKAIKASGAEIVTVAVRRVNILDKNQPLLMDYIDPNLITSLPDKSLQSYKSLLFSNPPVIQTSKFGTAECAERLNPPYPLQGFRRRVK